jgi:hypothetical protein
LYSLNPLAFQSFSSFSSWLDTSARLLTGISELSEVRGRNYNSN